MAHTDRSATRKRCPSFSSSAITQSVTQGMPSRTIRALICFNRRIYRIRTFRIQTVHHSADQLQLVLQTKINEIGVNENTVRWDEGRVVCQE